MSGDSEWFPAGESQPNTAREVAGLFQHGINGALIVRRTVYRRAEGGWETRAEGFGSIKDPIAWQELPPLPAPPPCWPPPGARLAELRRELAELAARRDEASNAALDCGVEIRRVEAEIARIEGGGG